MAHQLQLDIISILMNSGAKTSPYQIGHIYDVQEQFHDRALQKTKHSGCPDKHLLLVRVIQYAESCLQGRQMNCTYCKLCHVSKQKSVFVFTSKKLSKIESIYLC